MLIVGSADGGSIGKLEDLDCFVFLSNRSLMTMRMRIRYEEG